MVCRLTGRPELCCCVWSTNEKPGVAFCGWPGGKAWPEICKKGEVSRLPLIKILLSDIQFFNQFPILFNILALEIVQQTAALANELHQGTLSIEILGIGLQMPCKVVNPVRK